MSWKFLSPSGTAKTSATVNAPAGAVMDFAGAAAPTGWLICDGQEVSQTTYADLFSVIGTTYNTGGETAGFFRVPDAKGRVSVGPDAGAGRVSANNTLAATSGVEDVALTTTETPTHTHDSGTLATATHGHSDTLAAPSHTHTWSDTSTAPNSVNTGLLGGLSQNNWNSVTQPHGVTGTQLTVGSSTHTHVVSGTSSGPSDTALTGSVTNAGSIAVNSGNTGSALTQVAPGTAHDNLQPYIVLNKIIKY